MAIGGVLVLGAEGILEGTHLADEGSPGSVETYLWAAVVARVWGDAFLVSDAWILNTDKPEDPDIIRAEARRWLTLDFGAWKEDREEVCIRAGISPDLLHEAALRRIVLARIEDVARREFEIAAIDRAFEELVAREESGTISNKQMTSLLRSLVNREA